MATFLLTVIYIAFIGLGIPDSLFGTAWPAIYGEFNLPISYGSFVTVIISCGTVISSLMSSRVIARFGTGKVSLFSTLFTSLALLGFSLSPSIVTMLPLAVLLGIGAGSIDVALNNYVALHYGASHMSFLHCFYGIGVSLSPYVLSLVISRAGGWRSGYRIASLMQLAISVLLLISLPIWSKVHGNDSVSNSKDEKALTFGQTLKIPGVKLMCALFIASCAIESSCGSWGSTFLVESRGATPETAARIIAIYYVGMTLGRLISGIVASRLHSWTIIKIGLGILGAALVLLTLPLHIYFSGVAMFLIGLGNGPLFPNFNYLTPQSFGSHASQAVIGAQMSTAYIGIMFVPMLCGTIGQYLGMHIFPIIMLIFYLILAPCTLFAEKLLRRREK